MQNSDIIVIIPRNLSSFSTSLTTSFRLNNLQKLQQANVCNVPIGFLHMIRLTFTELYLQHVEHSDEEIMERLESEGEEFYKSLFAPRLKLYEHIYVNQKRDRIREFIKFKR